MVHSALRRAPARLGWVLALLALSVAFAVSPARAAPTDPTPPDEGSSNLTLGQALEQANAAWLQASAALQASKQRQADLTARIAQTEAVGQLDRRDRLPHRRHAAHHVGAARQRLAGHLHEPFDADLAGHHVQ